MDMYCPYCGDKIPNAWVKQIKLFLYPKTTGRIDIHCFNCEANIEITNRTEVDKVINK